MREVAWTIVRNQKRYLLVQRALEDIAGGLWSFPGGKIEHHDQHPGEAAARELKEETSLIARVVDKPLFQTILNSYKLFFFVCKDWSGKAIPGSNIIGVGWFTIPEIYNLDSSLDPFLSKVLPQLAFTVRHDFFGEQ